MLLLLSADCFKINFFKNFIQEQSTLSECQTVMIQNRTDILSVLIWVQTVCKNHQQATKFATRRQKVKQHSDQAILTLQFNYINTSVGIQTDLLKFVMKLGLCILGNWSCFFTVCWFFQNLMFSKCSFKNINTQSIKQFGSRSAWVLTVCYWGY